MSSADFTIDADPHANRGHDANNSEVLTLQLENAPATDVSKVEWSVVHKSKGAPDLVFSPANGQPATPSGTVDVTMPGSGTHFYILRCQLNNGVDASNEKVAAWTKYRGVAIRNARGLRKTAPFEREEYEAPDGWTGPYNEMVDYLDTLTIISGGLVDDDLEVTGNLVVGGTTTTTGAGTFATLNVGSSPFASTGEIRLTESPSIRCVRGAGGDIGIAIVTGDAVSYGLSSSACTLESIGEVAIDSEAGVRIRYDGTDKIAVLSSSTTIANSSVVVNTTGTTSIQFESNAKLTVGEDVQIHDAGGPVFPAAGGPIVTGDAGGFQVVGSGGAVRTLCPSGLGDISVDREEFEQLVSAGTTATVWTYDTGTGTKEIHVEALVFARAGGEAAIYRVEGAFELTSGTLTQLSGSPDQRYVKEEDSAWDLTIGFSGSDITLAGEADGSVNTTFYGTVTITERA